MNTYQLETHRSAAALRSAQNPARGMDAASHYLSLGKQVLVFRSQGDHQRWDSAKLIGRTFEARPSYDVMLATGEVLSSLPAEYIRPEQM